MSRRGFGSGTYRIRTGSEWDAQGIQIVRLGAPIALTTVGLPVTAAALRGVRLLDHPWLLEIGMGGISVILTLLMWKISNAKKWHRKWVHVLNVALSMAWLTASSAVDHLFFSPNGLMWTLWFLMAVGGSLVWILMNWKHADNLADLVDSGDLGPSAARYVDVGYIARAITTAPGVRVVTRPLSTAFPVIGRAHEQRAIEAAKSSASEDEIVDGEIVEDTEADRKKAEDERLRLLAAQKNWLTIQQAWRIFTTKTPGGQDLNGVRLVLIELQPTRIKTKFLLRGGFHTPEMFKGVREHMATMLKMSVKNIVLVPQSGDKDKNNEVHMDFVFNTAVAKEITVWPGAPTKWSSVVGEMVYGIYEDGRPASIMMAGDPKKHIVPRHVGIEGNTRAGKSNFAKIAVTAALMQYDVVDWAVDPEKASQTWGQVAPALDMIVPEYKDVEGFCAFLDDYVQARFRWLGDRDFDQWYPDCGMPFHRIWIEEANKVIPIYGEEFEGVARVALSAGVMLILSGQTWHHGLIPTPLRALMGDKMTYGFPQESDSFLLSKELQDAGADPSWNVSVPGKHYWMRSDLPLQDQVMTVRAFYADPKVTLEACRRLAPAKHARIRKDFPEWIKLIESLDANGIYKNRLTGIMLREKIDKNVGAVPPPRAEVSKDEYEISDPGTEEDEDMTPADNDHEIDGDDLIDVDFDEIDTEPEVQQRDRLNPDDETLRREMKKMGVRTDWLDEIGPDEPGSLESMMPHPDEVLRFDTPPGPEKPHTRQQVMDHLIATLAHKPFGPGKAFEPHEVAEVCRNNGIRRSRSWYRNEISTTLLVMGIVRKDRNEKYTVALDILSKDVQTRIHKELASITD